MELCTIKNIDIHKEGNGWEVTTKYYFDTLDEIIEFISNMDKGIVFQDTMDHLQNIFENQYNVSRPALKGKA